jgi:thioredoxin-like negative regulator of GroEL
MDRDLIMILIIMGFTILVVRNHLKEEFSNDSETVVYLFYADWCGASRNFIPVWEILEKNSYLTQKINIDTNKDMAKLYNIKFLPTIIIVKNGNRIQVPSKLRGYSEVHNFIIKNI